MFNQLAKKYEKGKSKKVKLIAVCIKAVTGVLGASMILTEQRPYITLIILCIGAVANEITNFYSQEEQNESRDDIFPIDNASPKTPENP